MATAGPTIRIGSVVGQGLDYHLTAFNFCKVRYFRFGSVAVYQRAAAPGQERTTRLTFERHFRTMKSLDKARIEVDFYELVQPYVVLLSKVDLVVDSRETEILLSEGRLTRKLYLYLTY